MKRSFFQAALALACSWTIGCGDASVEDDYALDAEQNAPAAQLGQSDAEGGGGLPKVTSTETNGPFAVTVDQRAGANSWVYRPTDLGRGGVKHPIFVWGTGATSVP